ncbi:NADPH-dependent FMN reductase [Aerococcus urinae]
MKIVGIIGNNASKSHNRLLIEHMANKFGDEVEFEVAEINEIPLFNADYMGQDVPDVVNELADKIEAADGVVISTAEYDHAITAALKSVIEWLSSVRKPFQNKPVMIVGASLGTLGSVRAQDNLRNIFTSPGLYARVFPGAEFLMGQAANKFDETGRMTDEGTDKFLDMLFHQFLDFINEQQED